MDSARPTPPDPRAYRPAGLHLAAPPIRIGPPAGEYRYVQRCLICGVLLYDGPPLKSCIAWPFSWVQDGVVVSSQKGPEFDDGLPAGCCSPRQPGELDDRSSGR